MNWLRRKLTGRQRSTLTVDTTVKMNDPVDCEHHWVDITSPFDRVYGRYGRQYLVRTYVCGQCNIRRGAGTVTYNVSSKATQSELVDEVLHELGKRGLT